MARLKTSADCRLVPDSGAPVLLNLDEQAGISMQHVSGLTPKIVDSAGVAYQDADPDVAMVFEQSDWSGGMGLDKVREISGQETRYATANGVVTWITGEVSPLWDVSEFTIPTSASALGDGARFLRMYDLAHVSEFDVDWDAAPGASPLVLQTMYETLRQVAVSPPAPPGDAPAPPAHFEWSSWNPLERRYQANAYKPLSTSSRFIRGLAQQSGENLYFLTSRDAYGSGLGDSPHLLPSSTVSWSTSNTQLVWETVPAIAGKAPQIGQSKGTSPFHSIGFTGSGGPPEFTWSTSNQGDPREVIFINANGYDWSSMNIRLLVGNDAYPSSTWITRRGRPTRRSDFVEYSAVEIYGGVPAGTVIKLQRETSRTTTTQHTRQTATALPAMDISNMSDVYKTRIINAGELLTVLNANDDPVLAYTDGAYYCQSTDAQNWSTPIKINNNLLPCNAVAVMHGVVIIGRDDGLHVYDNAGDGAHKNIEPNVGFASDRYNALAVSGNELYASVAGKGVLRIVDPLSDSPTFIDITSAVQFPHWPGQIGNVFAMLAWDGMMLICTDGESLDTAPNVPATLPEVLPTEPPDYERGACKLVLYDPHNNVSHELLTFQMQEVRGMLLDSTSGNIYIYGYKGDVSTTNPTIIRINTRGRLPPYDDRQDSYRDNGWVTTAWMDFGYAANDKVLDHIQLDVSTREMGGVKVEYRTEADRDVPDDSADSWHLLGTTTASTEFDNWQGRIESSASINFKRIRFRYTLLKMTKLLQVVSYAYRALDDKRIYQLQLETEGGTPGGQDSGVLEKLEKLRAEHRTFDLIGNEKRMSWLKKDRVRFMHPGLSIETESVLATSGLSERRTRVVVNLVSA